MPRNRRSTRNTKSVKVVKDDVNAKDEYAFDHKEKFPKKVINFQPKTYHQKQFVGDIADADVIVGIGPAGTGRTFCSASVAAQMLLNNEVDKILLTRANVTVGRSIGMLPGDISEKMVPLLLPILNVLKRQLGEPVYEYLMRKKKIEMLPIEYVRGMSFIDTFVIVDEAQNLNADEIKALCTRFESGKIILIGDPTQNDMRGQEPGISWLERFANNHDINIPVTRFDFDDIVRSSFVKNFLLALESEKTNK
jgi:phosphate starvation-inducible PhoH-like protein